MIFSESPYSESLAKHQELPLKHVLSNHFDKSEFENNSENIHFSTFIPNHFRENNQRETWEQMIKFNLGFTLLSFFPILSVIALYTWWHPQKNRKEIRTMGGKILSVSVYWTGFIGLILAGCLLYNYSIDQSYFELGLPLPLIFYFLFLMGNVTISLYITSCIQKGEYRVFTALPALF